MFVGSVDIAPDDSDSSDPSEAAPLPCLSGVVIGAPVGKPPLKFVFASNFIPVAPGIVSLTNTEIPPIVLFVPCDIFCDLSKPIFEVSPDNIPGDCAPRGVSEAASLLLPVAFRGETGGRPPLKLTTFARNVLPTAPDTTLSITASLPSFLPPMGELGLSGATADVGFLFFHLFRALFTAILVRSLDISLSNLGSRGASETTFSLTLPCVVSGRSFDGLRPMFEFCGDVPFIVPDTTSFNTAVLPMCIPVAEVLGLIRATVGPELFPSDVFNILSEPIAEVSSEILSGDSALRGIPDSGLLLLLSVAVCGGSVGKPPLLLSTFARDVSPAATDTSSFITAALTSFLSPTEECVSGLRGATPDLGFAFFHFVIALCKPIVVRIRDIIPDDPGPWRGSDATFSLLLPGAITGATVGGPLTKFVFVRNGPPVVPDRLSFIPAAVAVLIPVAKGLGLSTTRPVSDFLPCDVFSIPPNPIVDVSPDNILDDGAPRGVSEAGLLLLLPGAISGGTIGGPAPTFTAFDRDIPPPDPGNSFVILAAPTKFIPPAAELGLTGATSDGEFLLRNLVNVSRKANADASPGIDPKSFDPRAVPEAGLSFLLPSVGSGGTVGGLPPKYTVIAASLLLAVTPPNV